MKFSTANRKVHYWLALVAAVPVLLVVSTGLLLQLKKQLPWVQPPERRGVAAAPEITFERVLEICRGIPEAKIEDWGGINRIDVRPSRGMLKVTARNNYEIQIDTKTGVVLQVAYRRSDVIESLHDGSFFSDGVKLGVFLPAGVLLLVLWVTGMYLFVLPYWVRWKRKGMMPRAREAVGEGA